MNVAIITDTTSDWTIEACQDRNVIMIPLKICFGEESFKDQYEISSEEFYDKMIASEVLPTTSQPSPGDFSEIFERLHSEGFDAAICLHIAAPLSGTTQSARIAAETAPMPVHVLETSGTTAHLGLLVDAACVLRDKGFTLSEMVERLAAYQKRIGILLAPESLDNLVRGGRFPEEAAKQAGMLNIRMVLTLNEEGVVVPFDKVKGAKRQVARCAEFVGDYAKEHGPCLVRIVHVRNEKVVNALVEALSEIDADYELVSVDCCGATIATHLGMGAYGIAVAPREIA